MAVYVVGALVHNLATTAHFLNRLFKFLFVLNGVKTDYLLSKNDDIDFILGVSWTKDTKGIIL